ncbi:hypothetical protein HanIR_Chr02g0065381 [Helianthus annuus]|nr:hypothetical protein HanIR_Chr02g0065381 [Helianthus annuus]
MSPAHIHHTHTLVSSGNETNRERERDRGSTRKTRVRERERRNTLTSLRLPETATRLMTPHGDDYDDGAGDDNLIYPVDMSLKLLKAGKHVLQETSCSM